MHAAHDRSAAAAILTQGYIRQVNPSITSLYTYTTRSVGLAPRCARSYDATHAARPVLCAQCLIQGSIQGLRM